MMEIITLMDEKKFSQIREIFLNANIADIAAEFEEVENREQAVVLFKLIPKDTAAEIFAYLSPEKQQILVESFSDKEIASIIKELYIDDAIDFIEEMPANVVERVLKNTDKETREIINTILMYPENSAGSLMTIEFVDLKSNMTVSEAFARIRRIGVDKETINICYVTDSKRVLQGVVSVRTLLLASPESKVEDLMTTNVIFVNTSEDQENIAKLFSKYDMTALPVVDKENRLVGIITVDDVIDIIQEENTEDFQKMAALGTNTEEYLKTSVVVHAKKRILWLLILMISSTLTGAIIANYQNAYLIIPALVGFLPMIMNTGGNSGSQTSTLVIRGMALGEIKLKDFAKVLFKELRVALLVGFILAIFNFGRIYLLNGDFLLAFVVAITLYFTVIMAKILGFMMPMLAKALKLDPALMSAPLISTIVDALSVLFYFTTVTLVFNI